MEFIKGKWYRCSCNDNLYRYYSKSKDKFHSDAVFNPKSVIPGYTKGICKDHCIEYFDANKFVDINEIKHLLPADYNYEEESINCEIY